MPSTVVAISPSTGHDPYPNEITSASFSSLSHFLHSNTHSVKEPRRDTAHVDARPKLKLKLREPFSKKARRIITDKTVKLIQRRNDLDRQILIVAEKRTPTVSDWLPRDQLLRNRGRLEKQEQHHLSKRTKQLAELERLYCWDPSSARADDYDLLRKLLWRFKRNLGPLLNEYISHPQDGDVTDEMTSSGPDSDSDLDHERAPGDATANANGLSPQQENGVKRKHETAPVDTSPKKVKKVRFALDTPNSDANAGGEHANREATKKTLNSHQERQTSVREPQSNDK